MTEQHPAVDVLLDLALADVGQGAADLISAHLDVCPACRARYSTVSAGVEDLLAAAPAVPPPPGFSGRVLGAMGLGAMGLGAMGLGPGWEGATGAHRGKGRPVGSGGPSGAGFTGPGHAGSAGPGAVGAADQGAGAGDRGIDGASGPSPAAPAPAAGGAVAHGRPPWRRRVALLAAAGLVVLVGAVGVGIGLMIQEDPPSVVATGQLVSADGSVVGSVFPSRYEGEKVAVVRIEEGGTATSYTCRFVRPDGTTVDAGTWDWHGQEAATWIVPLTPDATSMEVVTETGAVWATASL